LTSNNIFDRFLSKDKTPENATKKMISLGNGYRQISKDKNFTNLLDIDIQNLDKRIFLVFLIAKQKKKYLFMNMHK